MHFGVKQSWDLKPVQDGRFQVLPQPVSPPYTGEGYTFKSRLGILRQLKPDYIFVMQEEMTNVLFQVCMYRNIWSRRSKVVFFSWNNIKVRLNGKRMPIYWRNTCTSTSMAIAGNQEVKQVLQKAGYKKPVRVQTEIGVDEKVYFPNEQARNAIMRTYGLTGFVIGFSGRLIESKGILDLFIALRGLHGDWSILIVGDGPLCPQLKRIATSFPQKFVFTGMIDVEETPSVYAAMDCLVLPSRTTPDWKEQFGLVLAQAMACKVAVIGSSSGAIPEVIGDVGLIFPEGDIPALQDALKKLINDASLRNSLTEAGYNRFMNYYSASALAAQTYSWIANG
jgi:glycosyltransferase involved in cell wall biosynthesis